MISVLLADDQALLRAGFRMLLESAPDMRIVGEAQNGGQAVALAREHRPDVVLMDVRMPEVDGVTATRRITSDPELAAIRVVVLTTFDDDETVLAALRAGAYGFLVKDTEPDELLHAIRVVARGDALLAPSVTRTLLGALTRAAGTPVPADPAAPLAASSPAAPLVAARSAAAQSAAVQPAAVQSAAVQSAAPLAAAVAALTQREREVVSLVAAGLSNDEIATELVVSPLTAKTHVSRAMVKLGARDRAQLVVLAFRTGLATPPRC